MRYCRDPMTEPAPPPKYVVIGHSDLEKLLEYVFNAPIPRVVTDPIVQTLTRNIAPLPAKLNHPFEKSVQAVGGKINEPPPLKTTGDNPTAKTAKAKKSTRRRR